MERDSGHWKFQGFSSPNGTYVPDEFFDQVAPRLSGAEVKLALYMIRRTYGFKKESDNIALSQMLKGIVRRDGRRLDLGAGLSKPTLLRSIKRLEEKNIIHRTHQWDMKGGCLATNYRLNVRETTPGTKSDQGGLVRKPARGRPVIQPVPWSENRPHKIQLYNIQLTITLTLYLRRKA
jgi:hypothetical protein